MAALSLVDPQTKVDAAAAAGEDEYSIVHFNYNNNDLSIGEIPTGNIYKQTLLSSSLFDLANSNGLVVTIDFPDSFDVEVRYKVCFKLMKKSLKPNYLSGNPVVEVNTEITNIVSSKSQQ
ncbi:hypothetical protein QL285_036509 [Trifolium repens]|nr:hypothetical protein QL285_036509 [Trifolium repens]